MSTGFLVFLQKIKTKILQNRNYQIAENNCLILDKVWNLKALKFNKGVDLGEGSGIIITNWW